MVITHTGSRLWWAGVIGPLLFTTLVIAQGLLQPDYSHVGQPISALAAWPLGWMQNLNFVVFALLLATFTLGLNRAVGGGPYGWLGPALMLTSSAGLLLVAFFPWYRSGGVLVESGPHLAGAFMTFVGAGSGLIVFARRMRADPRWRDLSTYLAVTGLTMLILFVVLGLFAIEDDAPLHPIVGVLQRLLLGEWFLCLVVVSLRMRRSSLPGAV
jgi:hypothetical membrane protein